MPLSPAQQTIANDPRRFITAVCGRRFGKTFVSMHLMAKVARYPNKRVWYIAPTYRMAKQIMWKQLKKRLLALNWIAKINESDLSIQLINGSEISLRSADNPDSLRGVGLHAIILDEAADMDPEVWHEVLRPTLSDTGGRAVFLGTPKGMNWLKDIYDMHKIDPDNWASYQFTTLDGGNVPAIEVEQAKRDLDERTFRQEYLASFETYAGLIYYGFSEANIGLTPAIDERESIHVGLDFNIQPLCATVGIKRDNHLYIIDELRIDGANTYDFCEELKRRYPNRRIEIYPDASGSQRRTSSATTDHAILANAGFTVRVARSNPPVLDRIAAVNSRLCSTDKQHHITINKNCKHLIKGLNSHTYVEGTRIPEKGGADDQSHMVDAFGYLVHWYWPIKRDVDTRDQPTYYGRY
jgi:hypothetical protein